MSIAARVAVFQLLVMGGVGGGASPPTDPIGWIGIEAATLRLSRCTADVRLSECTATLQHSIGTATHHTAQAAAQIKTTNGNATQRPV